MKALMGAVLLMSVQLTNATIPPSKCGVPSCTYQTPVVAYGGIQYNCNGHIWTYFGSTISVPPSSAVTNTIVSNQGPMFEVKSLTVTLFGLTSQAESLVLSLLCPNGNTIELVVSTDTTNQFTGNYSFSDFGHNLITAAETFNPIPQGIYFATGLPPQHKKVKMNRTAKGSINNNLSANEWVLTIQNTGTGTITVDSWSLLLSDCQEIVQLDGAYLLVNQKAKVNPLFNMKTDYKNELEILVSGDYEVTYDISAYPASFTNVIYAIVGINGNTRSNATKSFGVVSPLVEEGNYSFVLSQTAILSLEKGDRLGLYMKTTPTANPFYTSSPLVALLPPYKFSLNAILLRRT